jgi:hypothetical protein
VNPNLPRANRLVFRLFLCTIFFIYYETRVIPGTLHTWLMMIGLVLTIPFIVGKYFRGGIKLPLDYFLVFLMLALIVLGFVVNKPTSVWRDFQAYVLMLVTYVYVKENTSPDTPEFMYGLTRSFLLINGLFVMLQALTGRYFPAALLAAGDPPLLIPSGVSDGPTKNGMLIAFALSYVYAHLVFRNLRFSLLDMGIFLLGVASLLAATSRAGMLAFGAVAVLGMMFALLQSARKKNYRLSLLALTPLVAGVILAVRFILDTGIDLEALASLRDPGADRHGLDALFYKLTVFNDGSTEERFGTIDFFFRQLFDSPLQFFAGGFGPGSFESLYGLNVHNSYVEVLFTTGFFGFFSFLTLVVYISHRALSHPASLRTVPILFSLASFSVFMFAHDVLRGRLFWIALGIAAALSSVPTKRPRPIATPALVPDESTAHHHRPA